jgi:hypothetical protein
MDGWRSEDPSDRRRADEAHSSLRRAIGDWTESKVRLRSTRPSQDLVSLTCADRLCRHVDQAVYRTSTVSTNKPRELPSNKERIRMHCIGSLCLSPPSLQLQSYGATALLSALGQDAFRQDPILHCFTVRPFEHTLAFALIEYRFDLNSQSSHVHRKTCALRATRLLPPPLSPANGSGSQL